MLENLIRFFTLRLLLVNLLMGLAFTGGVFAWRHTPKEELPNVTFNRVHVSATYPGAPAEDVERLVTEPLEKAVRSLDGVYRVESRSSVGSASLSVELDPDVENLEAVLADIRNAVLDVPLPPDVEDEPEVRIFKTSQKAILDIGFYHSGQRILDFEGREELQRAVRAFENQLLSRPGFHKVNRNGYLDPEIEVQVRPEALYRNRISFGSVLQAVRENHLRQPVGSLRDAEESKVTLAADLDEPEKIRRLMVQGGFEGQGVRLDQLAGVEFRHRDAREVVKVNGYEGILLSVVKTSRIGILKALEEVRAVLARFEETYLVRSPVKYVLLDDESTDLRNRLSLIAWNGAIGFVLILAVLFLFLDLRSAFWVGLEIPLAFCTSLVVLSLVGFTINNMTLGGIIIVMGMLVDDAIIIAENVHRRRREGLRALESAVQGAREVAEPVTAAVLTTCAAFLPLYFLEGRWAQMNAVIPGVVSVMLGASLFQSLFLLPAHLYHDLGASAGWFAWRKLRDLFGGRPKPARRLEGHWFDRYEKQYEQLLHWVLPRRRAVFWVFGALLVVVAVVFHFRFKYVMFPQEETREVVVSAEGPEGMRRYETARLAEPLEDLFLERLGKEVVGLRTEVARSRRGGDVRENSFRTVVEIVPRDERSLSADQLIAMWEEKAKQIPGLTNVRFARSRWGQDSGSPIEVAVLGNDDSARRRASAMLVESMTANPRLEHVEIERDLQLPEYRITLRRDVLKRLAVSPAAVASALRGAVQGILLYELTGGEEEVGVRLTVEEDSKGAMGDLLKVPVENQRGYLVPLKDLVEVEKTRAPNSITRWEGRRVTRVFADLVKGGGWTPEEAAVWLEEEVFPRLLTEVPSVSLEFAGEIRETRESKGELWAALWVVLALIFVILAVLYDSLAKPLLIMMVIPFGAIGVVLAFAIHGITEFGLFAAVGTLGLAGVVVNDSIVMVFKLGRVLRERAKEPPLRVIAETAPTRLRAVVLTTLTTVAGLLPTAYGFAGYDATLAPMMLAMSWGLIFATSVTLLLVPCLYATLATRGLERLSWA